MRLRLYALALGGLSTFVLIGCGSGSSSHGAVTSVDPNAPTLDVIAKSFAFDPDAITVKSGDVRTLVLHVKDIPHDFTVKELDIHVHGSADDVVKQTIPFDKPGTYEFYCSIAGHRQAGMKGQLVVQ